MRLLFWLATPGREPALRRALQKSALPIATAVASIGNPADAVWLPLGSEAPRRPLIVHTGRPTAASR